MKIVTVADVETEKRSGIIMKTLFGENVDKDAKVTFGIVVVPPGTRVPAEGAGAHDGDEYSLILKGSLLSVSGGKEYRVSEGQAAFIPAGEEHWSINDGNEDCEIVWAIIKR
ncbi:MAG: cupin domain-containing protein [Desulfotomaculum sp.]|nr:cupin domain-containing protein [Desulfotomaculum sp.]